MRIVHPKTWWQASLFWGSAMFAIYTIGDAIKGRLTPARLSNEALIWALGGLAFGLLLTGVLSLASGRNLFRDGLPDKKGTR